MIPCKTLVLATGAWTRLARDLRLRLPVQPGKGYSLTLEKPDDGPRLPMILEEAAVGVTPWPSGLRIAGTMEFSGFDQRPRPDRFEAMRRGAARYLRDAGPTRTVEQWFGWRAMTPDELPIIGRSPRHDGVYIATGHGRMGVSMSPSTGRLIAELVTNRATHIDPTPYSPERFL